MEDCFKGKTADEIKLQKYGFLREGARLVYRKPMMDGTFTLTVQVGGGEVSTRLSDVSTGDEYTLHLVPSACGEFVGKVRAEYESELEDIARNCFDDSLFSENYIPEITQWVQEEYGSPLEFLWKDSPDAVWRRQDTRKWFGLLMLISKKRLGDFGEEKVTVLNVRADREAVNEIADGKSFFPAYHMNKKSWITLLLDGSIPAERVRGMIAYSYEHAVR